MHAYSWSDLTEKSGLEFSHLSHCAATIQNPSSSVNTNIMFASTCTRETPSEFVQRLITESRGLEPKSTGKVNHSATVLYCTQ